MKVGEILDFAIASAGTNRSDEEYERMLVRALEVFKLWARSEEELHTLYCDTQNKYESAFSSTIHAENDFAYDNIFIPSASYFVAFMLAPEKSFLYDLYREKTSEIKALCSAKKEPIGNAYV
jgi:hypothetical protein